MAAPPAKRQKKNVLLSSDDDDVPTPPSKPRTSTRSQSRTRSKLANPATASDRSLPTRSRTNEKAASKTSRPAPAQSTTTISPEKHPKRPSSKPLTNGSLHSFFNAASQASNPRKTSKSAEQTPEVEEVELEDIIEDDSADEHSRKLPSRPKSNVSTTRAVLDRRKPLQEQPQNRTMAEAPEKILCASQRFLNVGRISLKEASTQTKEVREPLDTRPWAEKYGPAGLEELMVHKKKVADVRAWLEGVLRGQDSKVCIGDTVEQNFADGPEETPNIEGALRSRQNRYHLPVGQSNGNRYIRVEEPRGHGLLV